MSNDNFSPPSHWNNDRRFFFKYMSRATGKIVLENQTLRWTTPGILNDPYDMQFDLHIDIDHELVKAIALQKTWDGFYGEQIVPAGNQLGAAINLVRDVFPRLTREEFDREFGEAIDEGLMRGERILPELQDEVRSLMADSKILCLTEIPDSILMWAHYAERHHGLVLQFKAIPELDSAWGAARPVRYLNNMPRLLDNDFLADMLSGRVSMDVKAIIHRLVYTKSVEWAYEREWRIFSGTGRNRLARYEDLHFSPHELDAAIVGTRMPEEDRAAFSSIVQRLYPHAQILQMVRGERDFQLEVIPLTR
jgi:hypothetical protein